MEPIACATERRTARRARRPRRRRPAAAPSFPWPFLLALLAAVEVVRYGTTSPGLHRPLRGYLARESTVFIPPSLDASHQRRLSINLGGGDCEWTPPDYEGVEELDLHKTAIVGFPSGDKRMIFVQMEALTGLRECVVVVVRRAACPVRARARPPRSR